MVCTLSLLFERRGNIPTPVSPVQVSSKDRQWSSPLLSRQQWRLCARSVSPSLSHLSSCDRASLEYLTDTAKSPSAPPTTHHRCRLSPRSSALRGLAGQAVLY